MPRLYAPKRRAERGICQSPILLAGLGLVSIAVLLLVLAQLHISPSRLSKLQARFGISRFRAITVPVNHNETFERFATLFHLELAEHYLLTQGRDVARIAELVATLKDMEASGITTVVFSSPWEFLQPTDGPINFDYLDLLVSAACQNTKLKVAFILDMVRAPAWVFSKWPDARAADSHNRQYTLLSWFHSAANQLAMNVLDDVVRHLVATHPRDRVTSLQPAFNNEYEAKYTQEHDCYQDYSVPALAAFRQWLQARRPQLPDLNRRWGTDFTGWEEVVPPVLEAGSVMGIDLQARYWDFLKFRELKGAEILSRACSVVQSASMKCFHHVPELFTVLVAVYGTTMFKHIAASPHTDYLVVDSSFNTPYGSPVSPAKLRITVSAAASYGKPVHLGAAVQQSVGYDALSSALRTALLAGAAGVGVTNWMPYMPPNATLAAAMHPQLEVGDASACASGMVSERVGLFLHFDSCAAWHGLQWSSSSKDPLHEFVQATALELSFECAPHLRVFLEFDRLRAALPFLDRVIFVEPLVLWAGRELEEYKAVRAAVEKMRHHEIRTLHGLLLSPGAGAGHHEPTVLDDL